MARPLQYVLIGFLVLTLAIGWMSVARRTDEALVVYCAHDLIFASQILDDFERETGIPVVVVGDTEATKSLGLVQRLLREKDNPVCDVFWNNQVLGTVELADAGVLQPYRGSGFERIPEQFKDPDGLWVGFGGRLRVWIVNTDSFTADESKVLEAFESDDLSQMTIAMPLYGTTLTHFTILWDQWGGEETRDWYADLLKRGCQISPGNATVKNLVAEGVCKFGWTDTDDYFVGLDEGSPVAMLPIRIEGKTICIPNSVAMIKGTSKTEQAQQLVDYLLSERVELALAKSGSRQVPLGPIDEEALPEDVRELIPLAAESLNVTDSASARSECLKWLSELYTSPAQ
ncbi:extracellular solute-binding protein [Thalassoglobus sp. JC818]|uniref:extracellular solute-binding protein n=1 Tax=Thalassoglobus sp. JC818 TaxID=3232136 RepID=UPI0034582986